jgi:subtilisin family serine protease
MATKVGHALEQRLLSAQDYDTFEVNIFLRSEPAREVLESLSEDAGSQTAEQNVKTVREAAATSQRGILEFLQGKAAESFEAGESVSVPSARAVESYWINNSVKAEVTRETLRQILERPDVTFVDLVRHVSNAELFDAYALKGDRGPAARLHASERERFFESAGTETWSVRRVNAPLLWQQGLAGQGVLVAVVDSGVNYRHPDLVGQMWQSPQYPKHGYDFISDDDDPSDADGHGTSCAGIVAGNGAAGKATGVAPKATIMAIRAGDTENKIWKGLQFAIDHGAKVISMSMSWKFPSHPDYPGWRRTCETILAAGILHANSIGNQGSDLSRFPIPYNIATPGNCPPPRLHPLQPITGGVSSPISCGATSDTDELASYSGRGPAAWEAAPFTDYPYASGSRPGLIKPDVCAPGPGTESCNFAYDPRDPSSRPYSSFDGTSSATPHVAGCLTLIACACLRSHQPIVPSRVLEAIETTAVRIPGQLRDKENHYGAGRIDAYAAYRYGVAKGWWDSRPA